MNKDYIAIRKGFTMVYWCRRCKSDVDRLSFKCKCEESPSPWDIKFERVEVKAGPRKLDGKWTFEMGEPVHLYHYEPWYERLWKKINSLWSR